MITEQENHLDSLSYTYDNSFDLFHIYGVRCKKEGREGCYDPPDLLRKSSVFLLTHDIRQMSRSFYSSKI